MAAATALVEMASSARMDAALAGRTFDVLFGLHNDLAGQLLAVPGSLGQGSSGSGAAAAALQKLTQALAAATEAVAAQRSQSGTGKGLAHRVPAALPSQHTLKVGCVLTCNACPWIHC